ncbi:MAG: hypothetical protein KGJ13_07080 [Patescibacteria group bacterium]|nr:hypothetical protein [Patescibacteria group bacterium]
MTKFAFLVVVIALSACVSKPLATPNTNNLLITALARISATGLADLQRVEKVASVPNTNLPGGIEDKDGLTCAQSATAVLTQVNAVNAAANGPGAGVLTVAEIASLFQPGSPQFNQATNTLTAGCIAKANDVLGPAGVVGAGGVIGVLASTNAILPLAAVAP